MLGAAALALALRLVLLTGKGFWEDEGYTWDQVSRSFGDNLRVIFDQESHSFLYYVLMWPVARLGDAELVLRMPSVLAGAIAVPFVAAAALRLFGPLAARIAAVGIAANATLVQYGQEARGYSVVLCVTAVSLAFFVADQLSPRRRWLVLWLTFAVIASYTHTYATGLLLAECGVALVAGRLQWRRFVRPYALAALAVAPLALLSVQNTADHRDEEIRHYMGPISLGNMRKAAEAYAGGSGLVAALVVVALVGLVAGRAARGRGNDSRATLAVTAVGALTFVVVVAAGYQNFGFHPRYALLVTVPLTVLVAGGLVALRPSGLRLATAFVLVATTGIGLYDWYANGLTIGYREAVAAMADSSRAGDGVLVVGDGMRADERVVVTYYLYREGLGDTLEPAYPDIPWRDFGVAFEGDGTLGVDDLERVAERFDRVWVVEGFVHGDMAGELAVVLPEHLAPLERVSTAAFDGEVRLSLYARAP